MYKNFTHYLMMGQTKGFSRLLLEPYKSDRQLGEMEYNSLIAAIDNFKELKSHNPDLDPPIDWKFKNDY